MTAGFVDQQDADGAWPSAVVARAQVSGARPYVVDGFFEVSDAVRRGHPVVLRRAATVVAADVEVFADATGDELVTVTGFDVATARYSVVDPTNPGGTALLTPRRLANYLTGDAGATGVALAG